MTDHTERQLLATGRPEPPSELRARVLAAAMPLVRADDSALDRLWFSPKWRIAVVISFVALAGVEVVSNRAAAPTAVAENQPVATPARAVALAAADLGLSPADTSSLVAQVRTSSNELQGANR